MIHLSDVTVQFGSQVLFQNASFQLLPGSHTGLVGPNGSGKTTVFRLIAGEQEPDSGEISRPKKTTVGYFSQDVGDMAGRTALQEVMAVAGDVTRLGEEIREMEQAMNEPMSDDAMAELLERYGDALEAFEHGGGYDLESRAQAILTGLGIPPEQHGNPVESFSGGWKMRIALARILTLNPDVLLLDEPTNHLDLESIVWLEDWLRSEFKGSVLLTSHDRDLMNRAVDRIVEVADGTFTTYTGNYDFYERERDIRREQLIASHRRQQEMLAKEEAFISKFAARVSHAAQVQSRIKKLEKIDRIELPSEEKTIRFGFDDPPRSGDEVVKIDRLGKTWPGPSGDTSVFGGISGLIRRHDKIAVVGVNGAGKSTFLKVVCAKTEPTDGTVTLGANVRLGYFSQHAMDLLSPDRTVFDTVQDAMPQSNIGVIRNLCAAFLFRGDAVEKKIEALSGGEKSRVVLMTLLAKPLNFLVLDEPTNHLDIRSRVILLDTLARFSGTILLVSHDRHFLRSIANRVFEIDHGQMRVFDASYDYYMEKKQEETGQ